MRITIVTMDTRGGVQPYLAVGLGLRKAGHEVRVVAPSDFTALVESTGLPYAPLTGGIEEAVRSSGGAATTGVVSSMRYVAGELPRRLAQWTREALAACEGTEVVVGGIGGLVVALAVAEKLKVPFVEAHLQPVGAPTGLYPGLLLAGLPSWIGDAGRRLSHHVSDAALMTPFRVTMAKVRREVLGLEGRLPPGGTGDVLYGLSPHVVPIPQEPGERRRVLTGYWNLPATFGWAPPPALEAFLAKGGPVVAIGFGSMVSGDPGALTRVVLGGVRAAGVRAVLVSGWGGLTEADAGGDVFRIDSIPYDWLLPRVQGVVHHGGAGTTGTALTAGTPSLVVPFMMDQPFWGARVAALGAGPTPIPRAKLTEENLAAALRVLVSDEGLRRRAKEIGELLRAEDGVGAVVGHFARLG